MSGIVAGAKETSGHPNWLIWFSGDESTTK
jgi:hypothetical protein